MEKKENAPCLRIDNKAQWLLYVVENFLLPKNKGEQTKTKMNNDVCIIFIKVKILSNGVSQKSKILLNLRQKGYFDQVL